KMHPLFLLWHTAATAFSFTFFMALFSAESYFSKSLALYAASIFLRYLLFLTDFFVFYKSHNVFLKSMKDVCIKFILFGFLNAFVT
ncbi:TPA: hypothetical protein ACHKIN_005231, partial [Escherichia coli]